MDFYNSMQSVVWERQDVKMPFPTRMIRHWSGIGMKKEVGIWDVMIICAASGII